MSSLPLTISPPKRNQPIPTHIFESLASIGCSESEILSLARCDKATLAKHQHSLATGRARLKHSLRRAQLKAALKGNSSMLIWLGKTYLAQSDQNQNLQQHTNIVVDASLLSSLQSSYSQTLSDIRKVKHLDSLISPPKPPAFAEVTDVPRGTLSPAYEPLSTTPERIASTTASDSEGVGSESDTIDTQSIASYNTHHVSLRKPLVISESCVSERPTPPAVPPPPQTPTPTPKRPKSLQIGRIGLEKLIRVSRKNGEARKVYEKTERKPEAGAETSEAKGGS